MSLHLIGDVAIAASNISCVYRKRITEDCYEIVIYTHDGHKFVAATVSGPGIVMDAIVAYANSDVEELREAAERVQTLIDGCRSIPPQASEKSANADDSDDEISTPRNVQQQGQSSRGTRIQIG